MLFYERCKWGKLSPDFAQAKSPFPKRRGVFLLCLLMLVCVGCSRKPIQSSGTLPTPYSQGIGPVVIEQRSMEDEGSKTSLQELKALNQKAGSPTFGLIPAFYQLPESMPAGAVHIEQGQVFGTSYQSFWLQNAGPKTYAILPASVEQSQVFSKTMNEMLDAGVRFVEVSMADANQIIQAEKQVIEGKTTWFPGRQLPSGVALLVSIQRGQGLDGPTYVGRVIQGQDGRLLALATQIDAGPLSLEPLLKKLVSDSLRRLADEK